MTPKPPDRKSARPKPAAAPADADDHDDGDRPTLNPPFDVEAFARASAAGGPGAPSTRSTPPEMRREEITLTNEVELERARAQSSHRTTPPKPPKRSSTLPGMSAPSAPALSPPKPPVRANTPTALSFANSRVASVPEIPAARARAAASEHGAEPRTLSPSSIEAAVLGAIGSPASPEITEHTIDDPVAEMHTRFSLGDYTGALEVAEIILAEDPDDSEVVSCAEKCREILEGMCAARLGSLHQIPRVVVQRAQLRWLSIDHRAGFVLSLVDSTSTIENILDVSGMPRLDAMRVLLELVDQQIVALG